MNFKGCGRPIRRSVVQGVDNVEVIFHRQVIYNERCPPGTWLDFYAVPINRPILRVARKWSSYRQMGQFALFCHDVKSKTGRPHFREIADLLSATSKKPWLKTPPGAARTVVSQN